MKCVIITLKLTHKSKIKYLQIIIINNKIFNFNKIINIINNKIKIWRINKFIKIQITFKI